MTREKKKLIYFIGHFANGTEQFDGQTIKTHILFDKLAAKYGSENVAFVDTFEWAKKPLKLIRGCIGAAKNADNILIMPASRGAKTIVPLFVWLKKRYDFKLHYILIGGRIYAVARKNTLLREKMKKVDYIYAENHGVIEKLNDLNIRNVYYMPNFKNLKKSSYQRKDADNDLHCCVLSRIEKKKGIIDAVEVVDKYNRLHEDKIYLDIYGKIGDNFKNEFEQATFGKNYIKYTGIVKPEDSAKTIEKYSLLIFPTKYKTEGVPATIIDSYFAGTPVLASKWENFNEIITEGKTGFGYEFDNKKDFYNKLESIAKNRKQLSKLRESCLAAADNYSPEKATHILVANIDEEKI